MKKIIVRFTVNGKPPKKGDESIWGEKQGESVFKLREKAFEARKKAGLNECLRVPVKIYLTVFAPNITERKDREDYIGDLDSLVAGVMDSLQPIPEHPQFESHAIFKEKQNELPTEALIIDDDAQIVSIVAKKKPGAVPSYTVVIESE